VSVATTPALVPCSVPARARRVGGVPAPRVRPLAEVLPGPLRPVPDEEPDVGVRTRREQDDLDRVAAALRPVALRLLTVVADVLAGRRPPGDVGALLDADALATLVRAAPPRRRRAATGSVVPAPTPRAGLRGLRVCALGPRTAEVVAVVHGPDRVRALAARLERADDGPADPGRWRAVALWPG
jgi:hypothetical protein